MAAYDFPTDTPLCRSPEYTETRKAAYKPEQTKLNSDRRGFTTRQLVTFTGLHLAQMTSAEVVTLVDEFHDVTLIRGQEPFNVAHPRTGATIEAQFVKPPVVVKTGRTWRVEFDLEEI